MDEGCEQENFEVRHTSEATMKPPCVCVATSFFHCFSLDP